MDFEQARFNMVEQQIRTWAVLDQRVLDLVGQLHREDFVPTQYRKLAYADMRIPLGHDQVMMTPKTEARLLQELQIKPQDRILEVGTGSGYLTALLARSGAEVVSLEIHSELASEAEQKLAAHIISNATIVVGDAAKTYEKYGSFDVIVLTGSVPRMPNYYKKILNEGGRLAAIVGQSPVMEAIIGTRVNETDWVERSVFDTDLPRLIGVDEPPKFIF
ncbi:MAG TPA: protein-L-isoaspartate O-methyltransferase [Acidiferrobacteraceae bacterium]|nr:protein-L-isoaspartate O-methyltransferase [Acidiferrobacteraceae bacterium]